MTASKLELLGFIAYENVNYGHGYCEPEQIGEELELAIPIGKEW